jgi:hypothetical protein
MTFIEFKQSIRTWIVNTTELTDDNVIFSHGSGPRPIGQYAILNITTVNKLGEDVRTEERQVGGDIKATYLGPRKLMVSVNIYRDDTTEKMLDLKGSLDKVLTQDYFNAENIGITQQSEIRHIPEQIGKAWENRSQCDFFFYAVFTKTDVDIGEIKIIEVTNEISDEIIIVT